MRRHRLFCPDLQEGAVTLSPEESRHATASLRLSRGSEVVLFDGAGAQASGVITHIARQEITVEAARMTQHPFELRCKFTLGVAMGRVHRQGYVIEKCTELGVAAIWPILAERSTSRPQEAAVGNWSRRAVEAAKQSVRVWVPTIAAPMTLTDCLEKRNEFDTAAIADLTPSAGSLARFLEAHPLARSILILVGPEGGWSDTELEAAAAAGVVSCRLGPTVLRTETAAVAACAVASSFFSAETKPDRGGTLRV